MVSRQEIMYYVGKHFEQGTKHYGLDNTILTQEQVLAFVSAKKREGSMRYEPEPDKVWTYTSFTDYNSFIKERYPKPEKKEKTAEEIEMAKEKIAKKQSNRVLIEEKAQSAIKTLESWNLTKTQIHAIGSKIYHLTKESETDSA